MGSKKNPETRMVCAILAAQAAGLRREIVTVASVELAFLYQISDAVTQATETARDTISYADRLPPQLAERCHEVAAAQSGSIVDAFAFAQAQRLDLVSQMADFLAAALTRLAEGADALSTAELATLYVSEAQRRIHDETMPTSSANRP